MSGPGAVEGKQMRSVSQIPVREVMSRDVIMVRDDMTLQEVATFLTENQISGAPVEDAEGRLVGVVSLSDVARATSEQPQLEPERPRTERASVPRLLPLPPRLGAPAHGRGVRELPGE